MSFFCRSSNQQCMLHAMINIHIFFHAQLNLMLYVMFDRNSSFVDGELKFVSAGETRFDHFVTNYNILAAF